MQNVHGILHLVYSQPQYYAKNCTREMKNQ